MVTKICLLPPSRAHGPGEVTVKEQRQVINKRDAVRNWLEAAKVLVSASFGPSFLKCFHPPAPWH